MSWFGKNYDRWEKVWPQIFDKRRSTKAYEKLAEATTFGLASVKSEGDAIVYDSDAEGYLTVLYNIVYGLGYIVTREEMEDDQYTEVSQTRSSSLVWSMATTEEVAHANVFLNGFSSSYVGGDGVSLFSAAHPTLSGNQSNLLSTAASFSESALEDVLKQIYLEQNSRGLQINPKAQTLVVGTNNIFNAERVMNSQLRPSTANNDINATKAMGVLPGGVVANPYFGSSNAWYVTTNVLDGLVSLWRREVELEQDNDFDTQNAKALATMRFVPGWGDWRGAVGVNAS